MVLLVCIWFVFAIVFVLCVSRFCVNDFVEHFVSMLLNILFVLLVVLVMLCFDVFVFGLKC